VCVESSPPAAAPKHTHTRGVCRVEPTSSCTKAHSHTRCVVSSLTPADVDPGAAGRAAAAAAAAAGKTSFIELFAGIGGFRLGLEALGWAPVFASELGLEEKLTYAANCSGGEVRRGVSRLRGLTTSRGTVIRWVWREATEGWALNVERGTTRTLSRCYVNPYGTGLQSCSMRSGRRRATAA
jgi:hypothetical protein